MPLRASPKICECRLNTLQPARLGAPPAIGETVGLIVAPGEERPLHFWWFRTPFPNMAGGLLLTCKG